MGHMQKWDICMLAPASHCEQTSLGSSVRKVPPQSFKNVLLMPYHLLELLITLHDPKFFMIQRNVQIHSALYIFNPAASSSSMTVLDAC